MQTSLWALQVALVQRLRENTDLMNKITAVEDSVSATAVKPYITIGDPTVTPFQTKITFGENIVTSLHVWSEYPGKKEAIEILNLILSAIKGSLAIEGPFKVERKELVSMNVLDDPVENGVKHGVMELRFYINNK